MRILLFVTLGLVAAVATIGCRPAQPAATPQSPAGAGGPQAVSLEPDPRQVAVAAKDALFQKLSARLLEVMSNGGPAAAIEVCSREAPQLAADVGREHGVAIGRTSFKLRNSQNAPPQWARPLIEQRSTAPQFIDLPDGQTGALLPIMLKPQCLACHGPEQQIADAVKTKLQQLYPDDQATGFQEGDLRGWFWVEVPARKNAPPGPASASGDGGRQES